jgi:hypothetical protein
MSKGEQLGQLSFANDVRVAADEIVDLLISKNEAYGNSALDPVRVFSKADNIEQLNVRIDDKLSRLARGKDAGEDVIKDLLGYLLLYRVQQKRNRPYEL